jgi:hypothetical protein
VDLTFIPTETLPENEPVRGGIQNSASVYTNTGGASQTFQETAAEARSTDWKAGYPELSNVTVIEVNRQVGDESLWIRISGFETCTVQTPVGQTPGGPVETFACPGGKFVVDDYVIFRAGRTRSLLKVLSQHATSESGIFEEQVQAWAELVVERANATFPATGS